MKMMCLRRLSVCVAVLTAGILPGCSRTGSSGNWGSGLTTINSLTAEYSIVRLEHDRLPYLILAVDLVGHGRVSGGTGVHSGRIVAVSGMPELVWSCSTETGRSGNVVIADQSFDLTNGGLFLVTTSEQRVSVRQVATPLEHLQDKSAPRGFSEMAHMQPQIAHFLKTVDGGSNEDPVTAEPSHSPDPADGKAADGEPSPPVD